MRNPAAARLTRIHPGAAHRRDDVQWIEKPAAPGALAAPGFAGKFVFLLGHANRRTSPPRTIESGELQANAVTSHGAMPFLANSALPSSSARREMTMCKRLLSGRRKTVVPSLAGTPAFRILRPSSPVRPHHEEAIE